MGAGDEECEARTAASVIFLQQRSAGETELRRLGEFDEKKIEIRGYQQERG